jgi:hypothetical protein
MRTIKILTCTLFAQAIFLTSCEKDKIEINPEIEATFILSENQAASENITDDATSIFFEAAVINNLYRTGQAVQANNSISCATVTVSPQSGFPKSIVVDFGNGCTSADGISRKGKINITLSNFLHLPGSTATITFDNYYTTSYKVEGTILWTNTSTANTISWSRQVTNGKLTSPGDGYYWMHEGTKYVTQTAGSNTPLNLLDDIFSITGSHSVTNPVGKTRTVTITEALIKPATCYNVTQGKIKIQGPDHFAILDYGTGTCDREATISIDGYPPKTFLIP